MSTTSRIVLGYRHHIFGPIREKALPPYLLELFTSPRFIVLPESAYCRRDIISFGARLWMQLWTISNSFYMHRNFNFNHWKPMMILSISLAGILCFMINFAAHFWTFWRFCRISKNKQVNYISKVETSLLWEFFIKEQTILIFSMFFIRQYYHV